MSNESNDREIEQTESLNNTGCCAYSAIAEMVAALQCDYDRLEELREERDEFDPDDARQHGPTGWAEANPDEASELAELEEAAGECESEDDARQRIEEDALELTVRSDWQQLGEALEPSEYCILLTTGGPAVRIVGALNRGEPETARLEVQDWGTPWTDYRGEYTPAGKDGFDVDEDVLLAYAGVFYFGEG